MFQKALDLIYGENEPVDTKNEILKLGDKKYRAIALWACHYGFNELAPKENDLPIPNDLTYLRTNKNKLSPEIWAREDIETYITQQNWVERQNRDNYIWLKQILEWLDPLKDQDYILMVKGRISEFEKCLNGWNKRVDRVREVFSGDSV